MEKLTKALAFLVASRQAEIASLLARRGYTAEVRREGWGLLAKAGGADQDHAPPPVYSGDAEGAVALGALNRWQDEWLPVLTASLTRHYPALAEKVLVNLSTTHGKEGVVVVNALLTRLEELKDEKDGEAALELLASRGFTADVRKAAAELLRVVMTVGPVQLPDSDVAAAVAQEKALEELWAWYGEWSHIARAVVTRGDHLIRLGMRKRGRPSGKKGEVDESSP